MTVQRLSAQAVESVPAPASGRTEVWDTLVRGLGLRVTERGAKSWVIMYRVDGRQRRHTLGTYPDLKLKDAREEAREALRKVAKGGDPAEEKIAARRAPAADRPESVEEAAEEFIERYAKPKNRSWKETERIFQREVLPRWGKRPVGTIARRDVIELLDDIIDRGAPYMANRVLACVRRLFNWCVERDKISASPAANVKAPGVEAARDRVLSDEEIKTLWGAWESMGWPFGLAFRLLLVTAQRRDEVASMRWSDINLEQALWTLPRERTKSDRLNELPLSSLAIEILEAVPRTGEYVFSTTGRTPISGYSKAKRRCDKLSGVTGWRIHDLRRTAASGMARLGIAPHVVEKVLNHANGQISGVAAVYNRHGYTDEKRHALEAWANALTASWTEESPTVVLLPSRG